MKKLSDLFPLYPDVLINDIKKTDEELISFSNNHFYDDSLYTFPSPEENNKQVEEIKKPGTAEVPGL